MHAAPAAVGHRRLFTAVLRDVALSLVIVLAAAVAEAQPRIPAGVAQQVADLGSARIIVGVSAPWVRPEGHLPGPAAIASQRAAIRHAVDRVLMALTRVAVRHRYAHIPFFSARVDAMGLAALAALPEVVSIEEDRLERLSVSESVPLIGAPPAWSAGATGAGWNVAVLDTGFETTHPLLAGKIVAEACYSGGGGLDDGTSLCPGEVFASTAPGSAVNCSGVDLCPHGTHVAGIAVGAGVLSGVAPGAGLIPIQIFTRFEDWWVCGSTTPCLASYTSDQIAALDHAMSLAGAANVNRIAAVNMSLSGARYFDQASCDIDNASRKASIDHLRSIGIATVVASGNDGFTDSLSAPACISSAVSVGSTTKWDQLSSFTNRASFLSLVAPGSSILSAVPPSSAAVLSGTSMAAPHVAGAWAVLKSAAPAASVTNVLDALRNTGSPINDDEAASTAIHQRINVSAACISLDAGGAPGRSIGVQASVSGSVLTVSWTIGAGRAPSSHVLSFFQGGVPVARENTGAGNSAQIQVPEGVQGSFTVTVTAFAGCTQGPASAPAAFTIGGGGAPGQPINVQAAVNGSILTVSWTIGTGAAPTSHVLNFTQGGVPVASLPSGGGNSAQVNIPPGVAGLFSVTVTPFAGATPGPASAPAQFTIGGCVGPPPAVTNLTGGVAAETTTVAATVTWTASPGATSYLVQAGAHEGGSEMFNANIGNATGVHAGGLSPGFRAWVRVVAVNACGNSGAMDVFVN